MAVGFTVGQVARSCGMSRTALLYYHRLGLLTPAVHREFLESLGMAKEEIEKVRAWSRAG